MGGRFWRQTYSSIAIIGVLAILGIPGIPSLEDLLGGNERPAAPTKSEWRAMGNTDAPNRVLRRGCHDYSYRYRVSPPAGTTWSLQLALKGPKNGNVGSNVITSGQSARRGTKSFRICRSNTTYGKFTIKGKLLYQDWPDQYTGWITPGHFRLRRP